MSKVAKIIVDILLVIVCVVGAYFLSNWLFTTIPVSGTSMTETIQDGDNVILYKQGNYRYGDIVVFNTHVQTESGESHYIKRIATEFSFSISLTPRLASVKILSDTRSWLLYIV